MTNLLETLEFWTDALDSGYGVDIIYLDYSKAFDTVPIRRLLKKLHGYGIRGKVWTWIEQFLSNRWMRVGVRGEFSEWTRVTSGVPQGSVLGPILFLLFINDIPEGIHSLIKLFADDTKVLKKIISENDRDLLQNDLFQLCDWSEKWLLGFNTGKCKCMHSGKQENVRDYFMRKNGENVNLKVVKEEKDLGVYVTDDLKWSRQCAAAANKAMYVLRNVKSTFNTLDIESFHIVYRTYIRGHLEYSVQAWSPFLRKDIKVLEDVQRRATKLVGCVRNLPYDERLKRLGLMSLEERRVRGDLIETYKIITGKENIKSETFFEIDQDGRRGHKWKLKKPRVKSRIRQNFYSQRVINTWNRLPGNVVECDTVPTLKKRLDKNWCKVREQYHK